jgi:hypothetical protein
VNSIICQSVRTIGDICAILGRVSPMRRPLHLEQIARSAREGNRPVEAARAVEPREPARQSRRSDARWSRTGQRGSSASRARCPFYSPWTKPRICCARHDVRSGFYDFDEYERLVGAAKAMDRNAYLIALLVSELNAAVRHGALRLGRKTIRALAQGTIRLARCARESNGGGSGSCARKPRRAAPKVERLTTAPTRT